MVGLKVAADFATVENLDIANFSDSAIAIADCSPMIHRNVLKNNGGRAIEVRADATDAAPNIWNNLIVGRRQRRERNRRGRRPGGRLPEDLATTPSTARGQSVWGRGYSSIKFPRPPPLRKSITTSSPTAAISESTTRGLSGPLLQRRLERSPYGTVHQQLFRGFRRDRRHRPGPAFRG